MRNSRARKKTPKRVLALPDLEHAKTATRIDSRSPGPDLIERLGHSGRRLAAAVDHRLSAVCQPGSPVAGSRFKAYHTIRTVRANSMTPKYM
jgi:hypothetical protein